MSDAPVFEIDPKVFHADPYPDLARMRSEAPIARVPQLGATLFTRHETIFREEKRIETFSSVQPGGLMTVMMGENMMRKDGEAHSSERKATFRAFSPRTVRELWVARFAKKTEEILDRLEPQGGCDLVADYAMAMSGEALIAITGLESMTWREMDRVSQGMIDGIANYHGDPEVEARCRDCTASIDAHIDEMVPVYRKTPNASLLSVQLEAGLPMESVRANVKLAISGGQNEPRDAIAGAAWALLTHPDQLRMVQDGDVTWQQVFAEYARWNSPIGMAPRQVARRDTVDGVTFEPGERVFLMFGSGNRDEAIWRDPDRFDLTRDCSRSIAFGAGPHFCAGAAASRAMIADVALPMLFARFPDLRLAGEVPFAGWAFRGPLRMPVEWSGSEART
ncbi:cytochrome P450 [Rhodobacterales bacterium HKCCE2091]|nr:cytochrome P450 [Rhodobacterales bacterium HKCCE2091]